MENILICVTEEPTSQKHISWSYREGFDNDRAYLILSEIVENSYRHPQAPEHATINKIEEIDKERYDLPTFKAAPVLLLKNALDNCSLSQKHST
jgi:hypothetical protein